MGRLSNSWTVFKQSLGVVRKDKELLLLPILSAIASAIMMATFLFPAYFAGLFDRYNAGDQTAEYQMYAVFLALYLVLSFITIYFQSALIFGADERLGGGNPTLGTALRGANKRLGKILIWSLFAATVSLLIQALEQALRRGGNRMAASLVGSILGTAWTLLTYFVIPVVVFEDKNPFEALRRSGGLFKQRWGESLVGQWGIGAVQTLIVILSVVGFGILAYLVGSVYPPAVIGIVVLAVLWLVFLTILGQALSGVYKAALYRFAAKGEVVPYFSPAAIQDAYQPAPARSM